MIRFRPLVLLGVLLLVPTLAFAAPSGNWTGSHIGVLFGGNSTSSDSTSNEWGFSATFLWGYNFQLTRHLVLGVDGFYEWNNSTPHDYEACNTCTVEYGSKVYGLQGRIGFPFGQGNDFMPYIKAGYGWYNLSGELNHSGGSARYGVGLEWMSDTGRVSLLIQYTHQALDLPKSFGSGEINSSNYSIGANFYF